MIYEKRSYWKTSPAGGRVPYGPRSIMIRSYRVAMICGVTPLVVGTSIFALWLVTRWDWLVLAGVYTIYGGTIIFLCGSVALARFYWLAARQSGFPRRVLWRSTLGCGALLLSNLVVAGGITICAVSLLTRYTVTVHNASQGSLGGVRISGGGCDEDLGTVLPGGTVRPSFRFHQDGRLEFRSGSGATVSAKTIDDYVTRNMGGHASVTIHSDGTISVSK